MPSRWDSGIIVWQGGDESVPVYELNAIRCGVDSL